MKKSMIVSGLALCLAVGLGSFSASAQDASQVATASAQQKELASRLPKTVVVRISKQTGAAEVLESAVPLKADQNEVASLNEQSFQPLDVTAQVKSGSELDSYVSRDSWSRGFSRGNWGGRYGGGWGNGWGNRWGGYGYNPGYSYYGYNYYYQPYYSCYNPYYTYYYYGWY